ncbi:hypothetical protein [Spirosoma pulveris]
MEYEIRLMGAEEDDGTIEFGRLMSLASGVKNIAKGALQIRLNGFSRLKNPISRRIQNALKINLTAVREERSTVLIVECNPFGESLQGIQGDIFNPSILTTLPTLTPMSLFMEAFRAAISANSSDSSYEWLDRPLLTDLKNFRKVFLEDGETIRFANRGSVPELSLRQSDFQKITTLEELTPESREIMVTGRLDELKYTGYRVRLETLQGPVNGVIKDNVKHEEVSTFWGKQVTVSGRGHYKPSGKLSFIEINRVTEASPNDALILRVPKAQTIEQQIESQLKQGKGRNRLNEIVGQWPGDESIDILLSQLSD